LFEASISIFEVERVGANSRLVDKHWNRIAHDDAVGKMHCDFEMNLMKLRLKSTAEWWVPPANNPNKDINDTATDRHKIMKKALSQNHRTKPHRQIFTVALRMSPHFFKSRHYGRADSNQSFESSITGHHFLLLGQEFVPFRTLVQRIKEAPPVVLNAKDMYDAYYDEPLRSFYTNGANHCVRTNPNKLSIFCFYRLLSWNLRHARSVPAFSDRSCFIIVVSI
jgi:hypothetical protein